MLRLTERPSWLHIACQQRGRVGWTGAEQARQQTTVVVARARMHARWIGVPQSPTSQPSVSPRKWSWGSLVYLFERKIPHATSVHISLNINNNKPSRQACIHLGGTSSRRGWHPNFQTLCQAASVSSHQFSFLRLVENDSSSLLETYSSCFSQALGTSSKSQHGKLPKMQKKTHQYKKIISTHSNDGDSSAFKLHFYLSTFSCSEVLQFLSRGLSRS